MPNQLIGFGYQLNAKRGFFKSTRHIPGFGIATIVTGLNQATRYSLAGTTFKP